MGYLVYTMDQAVMTRLGTDKLYYTAPFVVFGILRYWQVILVQERAGSPTKVVLTDPYIIAAIFFWLVTFAVLIYP